METHSPPPPRNPDAARAYTKRLRWAGELQFLVFFLVIAAYGMFGLHQRSALSAKALTTNFYLQIALCWLSLWAVCTAGSLLASCYTYSVQRKFQLATGGLTAWLWDFLKASTLLLVIGGTIVEIAFASHLIFPSYGWICAGLLSSSLFLGITRSLPWILSLFYPVVPLGNAALRERLAQLATKAGMRAGAIYEWRISARTRQANAVVTGVGAARRILLTDTLLAGLADDEVEAMVAHEFGHCALHHITKRLLLQSLIFTGIFCAINFALHNGLVWFSGDNLGWADLKLLPGLFLYWSCARAYGNILLTVLTRKQENAADLYSWKLVGRAEPFITGMRKLSELNLIVFDKSSQWRYAHPATSDRLAAAEKFARANGEMIRTPEPTAKISSQAV